MQIIRDSFYISKLDEIIDYMAQNSLLSTIRFLDIFKYNFRKVIK